MANLNKVILIGRLTRDVEVRAFSNGGKVAKFGYAVNNRVKRDNNWVDDPVYLNVEAFNRGESGLADRCERFLRKGSQCYIEGHLVLDQWTAQSGEKRSAIKVVMERLELLDGRPGGAEGSAPPSSTSSRRPSFEGDQGGGSFQGGDYGSDLGGEPDGAKSDLPF